MKTRAIALVLATVGFPALMAPPAIGAPEQYTFDEAHTYPAFELNHLGWSTTRGFFGKAKGKAMLDFAGKAGSLEIAIDAASVQTGDAKRDEHLRGPDFFNVAKFPGIQFRSNKVKFDDNKIVEADGELTLLGVTKPVTLTVEGFKCGPHPIYKREYCGGDAYTTIKRSEFGMNIYAGAIGEDVKLRIQVEAAKGNDWGPQKK